MLPRCKFSYRYALVSAQTQIVQINYCHIHRQQMQLEGKKTRRAGCLCFISSNHRLWHSTAPPQATEKTATQLLVLSSQVLFSAIVTRFRARFSFEKEISKYLGSLALTSLTSALNFRKAKRWLLKTKIGNSGEKWHNRKQRKLTCRTHNSKSC